MSRLFYRFEFVQKGKPRGIYQTTSFWRSKEHSLDNGCPFPWDDFKLLNSTRDDGSIEGKLFGFTSIRALRDWFWDVEIYRIMSNKFDYMYSNGTERCLAVYTIEDPKEIYKGGFQDVVREEYLETMECKRYFNLAHVSRVLGLKADPDGKHAHYNYKEEGANYYGN